MVSYMNIQMESLIANVIKVQSALDAMNASMEKMGKSMGKVDFKSFTDDAKKADDGLKRNADGVVQYYTQLGKLAYQMRKPDGALATMRRFAYGFGAEGIFRGLNKTIAPLEAIDQTVGRLKNGMKEVNKYAEGDSFFSNKMANILTKINSRFDMSGIKRANDDIKRAKSAQATFFGRSASAQARMETGLGTNLLPTDKAERQLISRRRAERTLRSKRNEEIFSMITGIRRRKAKDSSGIDYFGGAGMKGWLKQTKMYYSKQNRRARFEAMRDRLVTSTKKVFEVIKFIGKIVKKYIVKAVMVFLSSMIYAVGIIAILYIVFKKFGPYIIEVVTKVFEAVKVVGKIIVAGLMIVWDGVKDIFNAFFSPNGGGLEQALDGVFKIFGGLIVVALGLLATVITVQVKLIIEIVRVAIKAGLDGIKFFFDSAVTPLKKIAVGVALVVGTIAFIASGAWAAVLAGAIAFYITKKIGGLFGKKASGGMITRPMTLVGERGPELVSLPRGSTVSNASTTRKTLNQGGNVFNITINARDTSDREMRRIAEDIGRMVSAKINRRTTSGTLGR